MKSILHRDKNFRHFESTFDRRAAKDVQLNIRRKREEARVLNTNELDDYSDIHDIWETSDDEVAE